MLRHRIGGALAEDFHTQSLRSGNASAVAWLRVAVACAKLEKEHAMWWSPTQVMRYARGCRPIESL